MSELNGVTLPAGKPQYQFNGLNSNNSSRGASPAPQLRPIPTSQLPPGRGPISQTQLPPTIVGVTQTIGQLTVTGQNTPNISPNKFSASTPTVDSQSGQFSENPSPIVPNLMANSVGVRNSSSVRPQTGQYFNAHTNGPNFNSYQSQVVASQQIPPTRHESTQILPPQLNAPQFPPSRVAAQNYPPPQMALNSTAPSTRLPNITQTEIRSVMPQPPPNNNNQPPKSQKQPNIPSFQSTALSQPPVSNSSHAHQISSFQNLPQPPPPTQSQKPPQISSFENSALPQRQSQQQILSFQSSALPNNTQPPPNQNQIPSFQNMPQPPAPNSTPQNFIKAPPTTQFPTTNQSLIQKSRYPQTLPPSLPPNQTVPLPSQRFNPQINYNVGFGTEPTPPATSNIYPVEQPQMYTNQQSIQQQQQPQYQSNVVQTGFSRMWGQENCDLLQTPNILPTSKLQPPLVNLGNEQLNQANCNSDVFRCTVTKIPESASLLQKSRLPLGLLIHPFKDLNFLPVVQCNIIVRCKSCRTYINPFVYFVDIKRWKCNLCYRVNELPEEFQYDPASKTYGDPTRRPEIKNSTIEYVAPAEYMLRPPQPAVYLFLLDVSRLAVESGYLDVLCTILLEEVKNLPGDARTQIGFLAFDSALHFFSLAEELNQPHEMTILDVDEVFLPTPDALVVNLKDRIEMIEDLLRLLPKRFGGTYDGNSALGSALQAAHEMIKATGGRVTVFQASLPNVGPGAVKPREDPNQRSNAETVLLNPCNDFYKRLALDCSGQQIAVDFFIVNSQYVDIATISGISQFSGGSVYHFPLFKLTRPQPVDAFQKELRRYLTRKIGFEAVMRVRCTRGLAVNNFHGNFFVRSPDLLALANINPDAAFGMQVAIEESLSENKTVCFQAALLYTSSKGERRIRVHTLCVPVANTLQDVIHSADQQCIVGLLGKMGVDRSIKASLSDAREAFINAAVDILTAYRFSLNMSGSGSGLLVPINLRLLPLYIAAILKHPAFRIGTSTRLDDRVKAMLDMKTKPLYLLMQQIYPDLYPIHNLELQDVVINDEEEPVPIPPRLHLSSRCLEASGAFLMDCGDQMFILLGPNVSLEFLKEVLGVSDYNSIGDDMIEIPILNNPANQRLHYFINYLNDEKPCNATLKVLRDNSPERSTFLSHLIEDRLENSLSYHEFLQHIHTQVK